MKELKRTTEAVVNESFADSTEDTNHYHIVFCDNETGVYQMAPAMGHVHQIQPQPIDPQNPQAGMRYVVMPAEDGHFHDDIIPYTPKIDTDVASEDESEIVGEVIQLFKEAIEIESKSRKDADEAKDFYWGKNQWDESVKRHLVNAERSALTINVVGKFVDELIGYQIQGRTDLHYTPVEGGDQRIADILNIVSKVILDGCDFAREETRVFKDQVVPGRGNFNIYVDHSEDLRGKPIIEWYPDDQVRYGPHEKHDLSDCEYVIKDKMYSWAKLKQLWPTKVEKLKDPVGKDGLGHLLTAGDTHFNYSHDQYGNSDNYMFPMTVGDVKLVDVQRKEYRVIECQRRIYKKVPIAINVSRDMYVNLGLWEKEDVEAVEGIPGFQVVDLTRPMIRITRIAAGIVLSDENPADLPFDDFNIIPVYAYKEGASWKGKVYDAMDPQRELNKRRSQSIDIINKMCSYGYFYDDQTFPDEDEEEKFNNSSSTPGFRIKVSDADRPPRVAEGVKFPNEVVSLDAQALSTIRDMLNVTVEPAGSREPTGSLLQRSKMKMMGNEFLFDNLRFAKKKIGKILPKLIKRYYSPERIYRIIENQSAKREAKIAGQPFSQYSRDEIINLLTNDDLTNYDVSIAESAYSPTARMQTHATLMEMAQAGAPIPPEALIEGVDLPEEKKQQIMQSIQAQQQSQAQSQSTAQDTEIQKTLLAAGYMPPEVAQKYGIQGQVPGGEQQRPPQEIPERALPPSIPQGIAQ